jgi:hypothetical protein
MKIQSLNYLDVSEKSSKSNVPKLIIRSFMPKARPTRPEPIWLVWLSSENNERMPPRNERRRG